MNFYLSVTDFAVLSPLLILLGAALVLLLVESFAEEFSKKTARFIALGALFGALYAATLALSSDNVLLTHWLRFDSMARFFTSFFLLIGIFSVFLSISFFKRFDATHGEYYFLLLSAISGLILIGSSADFLTLFLGLETLSISLYVLCGYIKKWELSHEAALKYFLMGALAAAFLLYGIALVYGAVGTTRFDALYEGYKNLATTQEKTLFLSGIILVTVGFAFKAAIVPFHTWAPDVYDGAPTPVTAFMAVGTKVGAFSALVVVFFKALPQFDAHWNQGVALLAYPTLIYANFVALKQTQMRRFFAYSGISHAGFLLIPIAVGTAEAYDSLLFYLVVYSIATLGAFAILTFWDDRSEGVMLEDLHGLFKRAPWQAGILTICLMTLAGIPPTVGFFAKFYIFKVAFQAGYMGLVIVGLLTTILSFYYYLRIVSVMLSEQENDNRKPFVTWGAVTVAVVSFVTLFAFSLFPRLLLDALVL